MIFQLLRAQDTDRTIDASLEEIATSLTRTYSILQHTNPGFPSLASFTYHIPYAREKASCSPWIMKWDLERADCLGPGMERHAPLNYTAYWMAHKMILADY